MYVCEKAICIFEVCMLYAFKEVEKVCAKNTFVSTYIDTFVGRCVKKSVCV